MDFLQIGVISVVLLVIVFWISNRRPKGFPPGPLGLPVVGFLPFFGELPFKTCVELGKKYGNVFSVKLGNSFVVVLNDWAAIKEALVNQSDAFEGRPQTIMYETAFNSDGVGKSSLESVIMEEVIGMLQKMQADNGQTVTVENYFYFFDSLMNITWSLVGGRMETGDMIRGQLTQIVKNLFKDFTNTNPLFFMPYLRHVHRKRFQTFVTNNQKFNEFLSRALQQHMNTYQDGHIRDFLDAGLEHMFKQEKALHKHSVPFTSGRLCAGKALADMSIFMFFTCLLHQFKFSLKPGEQLPRLDPEYALTLSPQPFTLLVKQRPDNLPL